MRGNHSRLAFGRSERGRSRSTRRRSRGHRIRFDRHGGDFTVRDSKKGHDFFFSNGQNIEKDAERRYFRNDSPVKSEGGRRGPQTVANRTRRAASPPRGSPDRGIEVDRQIEAAEETRPSWNPPIREPVDARSSEHRAPSRFANQASSIRGGRPGEKRSARDIKHFSKPNASILVGVGYYRLIDYSWTADAIASVWRIPRSQLVSNEPRAALVESGPAHPPRERARQVRVRVVPLGPTIRPRVPRSRLRRPRPAASRRAIPALPLSRPPRVGTTRTRPPNLRRFDLRPLPHSFHEVMPMSGGVHRERRSPVRGVRSPAASATRRRDVPRSDARVVIPGGHARDEEETRAAASSDKTRQCFGFGVRRSRVDEMRVSSVESARLDLRAVRAGEPQGEKYSVQVRAADGVVTGRERMVDQSRGDTR